MPVRVQVPKKVIEFREAITPAVKIVAACAVALLLIFVAVLTVFYLKYAKMTDQALARGLFPDPSLLYAAPASVVVGDPGNPEEIAGRLRQSGYAEDEQRDLMGWFHLRPDAISISPGPDSYFESEGAVIKFANGKVSDIISLRDNSPLTEYDLEPDVLTNLFDKTREKRRMVHYNDIPPLLVHAVISAEDKRFFQHSGFDPLRMLRASFVDLREMRRAEGASTITQQLARMLWLDRTKTFSRKFAELLITIHLEQKLTKQQIFEYYINDYPLGRRGSFSIRGFGEAAQAFFGKDLTQLTLPEAATLAGLIQSPSGRNPVRWPERAKARRNVVLLLMKDNGYITPSQYEEACAAPLVITKGGLESSDAPYFVDIVNQRLQDNFQDRDFNDTGYRVYTTLDRELQHDAMEAVSEGYKEVERLVLRRTKKGATPVFPQVALIALDPHTGEVKALVGGLNYGASQLNHANAERPSGSAFKPLVYATALATGLGGQGSNVITASTIFDDEPKTFMFDGNPYEPSDYKHEFYGQVPVRMALAKSLNVPTIEIAEAAGYDKVADLAHRVGLNNIRATPAMAIGAYNVTPLEMAGAYTMFANKGVYVSPRFIQSIHDHTGEEIYASKPDQKAILDPRVNYLVVNLMEEVLQSGTGAGVRARGFTLPAAGKTGTERDAWFAGFTTKLLCIVWVGYDDYRDLKLEGAQAALPIWTDFMKLASLHHEYRDAAAFDVPDGVVSVQIDPDTGELATSACPRIITEYYLPGTQPTQFCHLHSNGGTQFANWQNTPAVDGTNGANVPPYNPQNPQATPNGAAPNAAAQPPNANAQNGNPDESQQQNNGKQKKKSFLDKLKGIFK
ncbi:MAG: PBP1A family penicillin-binding protein [Bryobacteraceae bacterium]